MKFDMDVLEEKMDALKENVSEFNKITHDVIYTNCADLDSLMEDIKAMVTQSEAANTNDIERYYAELSNLVYFMAERLEKLNVFRDVSKATTKETYNKAYIKYCADKDEKGKSIRTVNENTSLAESDSAYDAVIQSIYGNAYDAVKLKVEMAQEMISTLRNILKRRMNEEYMNYNLSKNDVGSRVEIERGGIDG